MIKLNWKEQHLREMMIRYEAEHEGYLLQVYDYGTEPNGKDYTDEYGNFFIGTSWQIEMRVREFIGEQEPRQLLRKRFYGTPKFNLDWAKKKCRNIMEQDIEEKAKA